MRNIGMEAVLQGADAVLSDANWVKKYPILFDGNQYHMAWATLMALFHATYWKRVWILQEIILSKRLVLVAGNKIIPIEFIHFAMQFSLNANKKTIMRPNFIKPETWASFGHALIDSPVLLIGHCMLRDRWSLAEKYEIVETACSNNRMASDPRDMVFGVQSLAGNIFKVDYHKTVEEVYSEYAAAWIRDTGAFDFVWSSGILFKKASSLALPSWVPDWAGYSKLGSYPNFRLMGFNVTKNIEFLETSPTVNASYHLVTPGIEVDCIEKIFCGMDEPSFAFNFMREFKDSQVINNTPAFQAFLRAITLDWNDVENRRIDPLKDVDFLYLQFRTALGPWMDEMSVEADVAWQELGLGILDFFHVFPGLDLDKDKIMRYLNEKYIYRNTNRLAGTIHDKSLTQLFMTGKGLLGYGLIDQQVGDLMFTLKGSSYLVVLRKVNGCYIYVGRCMALGYMDGEIGDLVKVGKLQIQMVEIH